MAAISCASPTLAASTRAPGLPPTVDRSDIHRVAVFGPDERVGLPAKFAALRQSIGLVYSNEARSVCTAFCVADNVVATAAHCLFRTAGERPPRLGQFRFALHGQRQRPSSPIAGYRAGTTGAVVVAGSTDLRIEPPIDATSDWALARLASPICRGGVLPVLPATSAQVADYAQRRRLMHVAFHKDFPNWQLAVSGPCSADAGAAIGRRHMIERDFKEWSRLILHTCDSGDASSGSPLLAELASGAYAVVGLNVGTYVQTRLQMDNGRVVRRFKADPIANTAIAASAFHGRIAAVATAQLLTTRQSLRRLQVALGARNYYAGPRDGQFGRLLRVAIEHYERASGLPVTGLATASLLETLLGGQRHVIATARPGARRYQRLSKARLSRRFRGNGPADRTRQRRTARTP